MSTHNKTISDPTPARTYLSSILSWVTIYDSPESVELTEFYFEIEFKTETVEGTLARMVEPSSGRLKHLINPNLTEITRLGLAKVLRALECHSGRGASMPIAGYPQGGWEKDETIEVAARRETIEEAGVCGEIKEKLGTWYFENKSGNTAYEGHLFPLFVMKEVDLWPEKDTRERSKTSAKDLMYILYTFAYTQHYYITYPYLLTGIFIHSIADEHAISKKALPTGVDERSLRVVI
ncbi:Nudix hydrolase 21, chloroplastic [Capsicum annuum]|uniref:Nudix hydrolase 21, chloroplastic n=1 Tax=Capsicum annuum TaxID=4072 RepID=A0A2G2Z9X7_CAPAN|nr:Nudix hydrolase 21, chloroplastic [Capsicum annuum]